MVYLMYKHGPGGACDQVKDGSSVRAQLSMLRQVVDNFIAVENEEPESEDDDMDLDTSTAEESVSSGAAAVNPISRTTSKGRREEAGRQSERKEAGGRKRGATINSDGFGKVSASPQSSPQSPPQSSPQKKKRCRLVLG